MDFQKGGGGGGGKAIGSRSGVSDIYFWMSQTRHHHK